MKLRAHLALLLLFQALVVIFTYPLIRSPGGLLPEHHDPRIFSWAMASNAQWLFDFPSTLDSPSTLYHGNALYPYGSTVTYSEPLLVPSVVYGPIFFATGNPVLAYNLTLLFFWALSGWAIFFFAYALTGNGLAAVLAGMAFMLCPYRIEYYLEFQMHLAFGIPLTFFGWYRFLVTQRWRPLLVGLAAFFLTALSSLYYAVILALALTAFTLIYLLLRWRGWRGSTVVQALAGGAVLAASLAPFLWPYWRTRSELGFERVLEQQPIWHSADILTYFETRSTALYRLPMQTPAETVLFMGFVVLGLVALSLMWLRQDRPLAGAASPRGSSARLFHRIAGSGLALSLAVAVLSIAFATFRAAPEPGSLGWYLLVATLGSALVFGLIGFGLQGCDRWRAAATDRELSRREWVLVLLYVALLFFVLSLGPTVRLAGQAVGAGLYGYVYELLPFLRAIRVLTRLGVMVTFAAATLAALGAAWLFGRFPRHAQRMALAGLLGFLILAEFWSGPLEYAPAPWPPSSLVHDRIAEEAGEFAILEVPFYADKPDADEMLNSVYHGKYLVNGESGFVPRFLEDLAVRLREPAEPFPSAETLSLLRSIYPLRYIVVHHRVLSSRERSNWERLKQDPPAGIRLESRFGEEDLYSISDVPEQGSVVVRRFSYDFLRGYPRVLVSVRSIGAMSGGERPLVDIAFNDRPLASFELSVEGQEVELLLEPPFRHSAANTLVFSYRYETVFNSEQDPRYRLGDSELHLPFDLYASSDSVSPASSALVVNGRRLSLSARGYNLVALDPETGGVRSRGNFPTHVSRAASGRLLGFVNRLPEGTVLVASTSGNASANLTRDALQALLDCGGTLELWNRADAAHLLIGYRGAAPGTVIEKIGEGHLSAVVGQDPRRLRMEVSRFSMVPNERED